MKESARGSSDMQKAKKLSLPQHPVEVSKFLERNDFTTKMTGSALSRVVDVGREFDIRSGCLSQGRRLCDSA
jgi:hypothetical protein